MIGGWLAGEGGRSGRLGALVIGIPDEDGVLRYAGRVGTGFTQAELLRLGEAPGVAGHAPRARSRAASRRSSRSSCGRELVARVDFTERTQAGTLRQPSYKGLRDDVAPEDVRFG